MAKKEKKPAIDPTIPGVEIEIDGKTYELHFTYDALITAERALARIGRDVNMLLAMDVRRLDAERLPIVLFAALLHAHPNMTFEEARKLVTFATFPGIMTAVTEAYVAHMPKVKPVDNAVPDPPPANPD